MPVVKIPHYRRADNGHYVTPDYAKKHPSTTVKEVDKITVKKPPVVKKTK